MHGYGSMDGANWIWMSFMMVFLIAALGVGIFFALRIASRSAEDKHR